MIVLVGSSWKIPLFTVSAINDDPEATSISSRYGGDVNKVVTDFINDSFDKPGEVAASYSSGLITLNTSSVPYYADALFVNERASGNKFTAPLELRVGTKKLFRNVAHTLSGVFVPSILCSYIQLCCQIKHIEEKARREGHGLSTKERYQLESAKSERNAVGARSLVWRDSSDSPMRLNGSGLAVRAGLSFSGWQPTVTLTTGSGSGLQSLVASHKSEVKAFYRKLYPVASDADIDGALKDANLDDWYASEFHVYVIPSQISDVLAKPPLLLSLETLPTEEMAGLAMQYLLQTVPKAISSDNFVSLQQEYFSSLKKKGHSVSKSKLLEGRLALRAALYSGTGYDAEVDLSNVIEGSYRWSEFAKKSNNSLVATHPMLWTNVTFDGDTLSGNLIDGEAVSTVVPSYLTDFATHLAEHRSSLVQLLIGWEHFVASTYSASFDGFYNTDTTYRIVSFRPMLTSCGVTGSMMPDDIIGVLE
jgi:hypothetical protein